jgi:hypothetical protein
VLRGRKRTVLNVLAMVVVNSSVRVLLLWRSVYWTKIRFWCLKRRRLGRIREGKYVFFRKARGIFARTALGKTKAKRFIFLHCNTYLISSQAPISVIALCETLVITTNKRVIMVIMQSSA